MGYAAPAKSETLGSAAEPPIVQVVSYKAVAAPTRQSHFTRLGFVLKKRLRIPKLKVFGFAASQIASLFADPPIEDDMLDIRRLRIHESNLYLLVGRTARYVLIFQMAAINCIPRKVWLSLW